MASWREVWTQSEQEWWGWGVMPSLTQTVYIVYTQIYHLASSGVELGHMSHLEVKVR